MSRRRANNHGAGSHMEGLICCRALHVYDNVVNPCLSELYYSCCLAEQRQAGCTGWVSGSHTLNVWLGEGNKGRRPPDWLHTVTVTAGPTCPDRCVLSGQATSNVIAGRPAAFNIMVRPILMFGVMGSWCIPITTPIEPLSESLKASHRGRD